MPLSAYSKKFSDANDELNSLIERGDLTTVEEATNYVVEQGIDPAEFREARKEWKTEYDKGGGARRELRQPGFAAGRVAGIAAGKIGKGFEQMFPETGQAIEDKISKIMGERNRQALFFPSASGAEQLVGELGAYGITAIPAIRGLGLVGKGLAATKGAKAIKLGTKAKKRATFTGKALKIGGGWSLGTTALETPEENVVNWLATDYGDKKLVGNLTVKDVIGKLAIDPNDSKSAQYLQSFFNNLILEGGLGTAFVGLTKLPVKEFGKRIGKAVKPYEDYAVVTSLKDVSRKAKRYGSEWLTSRFGVNDEGLNILMERVGGFKANMTRASILADKLPKIMKDELSPAQLNNPQFRSNTLNAALAGDNQAMLHLQDIGATETLKTIKQMRKRVTDMSKYIKRKVTRGQLSATIGANLETYLNRSYRIFDDPSYLRKGLKDLDPNVKKAAEDFFRGIKGVDEEDIPAIMEYYTRGIKDVEFNTFLSTLKAGTSAALKQRKDIPVEIRNLWGEVKDPVKNYVNTYRKVANIITEYKFRNEIAEEALRVGKATRQSKKVPGAPEGMDVAVPLGEAVEEFGEEGVRKAAKGVASLGGAARQSVDDPLRGLFIDKAWKKAIDDGMEVSMGDNGMLRHWMKMKALSQAQKTIFSIPTHGRNIMGNGFLMVANGTINPKDFASGFKDISKRFMNLHTDAGKKRLARYQELGIIDSAVHVRSLEKAAGEAFQKGPDSFMERVVEGTKAGRLGKKIVVGHVKAYEAEDNLFKIWNYEQLKRAYRKALPDLSEKQLERFVAQRSRDMMPNYNMVPKALKALRAAPVGNFLAFPAEMVRNSKNILKYAWKDASGATAKEMGITDPKLVRELRNIGLKRAAGMTAAVTAGDAAVEQSKYLFGINDWQEEALNKTVPEWERGTNKIFLSPIKKDKKTGKITADYMNLGPIDPFSYWKTPAKMVVARMMNNQNYNEAELDEIMGNAFHQMISPFADPSMLTEELLDVYTGRGIDPEAGFLEKGVESARQVLSNAFTPGTVDFLKRRIQYEKSKGKWGMGKTQYGYAIAPGAVDLRAFLGVKRQTADLSHGFEWNIQEDYKNMNRSKSKFNNALRDYTGDDPREVAKLYIESLQDQYKNAQLIKGKLNAYRDLGFELDDMYKALTKSGIKGKKSAMMRSLTNIDNNTFMPHFISKDMILLAEAETKVPVPYETLQKIYKMYSGLSLEEEEE